MALNVFCLIFYIPYKKLIVRNDMYFFIIKTHQQSSVGLIHNSPCLSLEFMVRNEHGLLKDTKSKMYHLK